MELGKQKHINYQHYDQILYTQKIKVTTSTYKQLSGPWIQNQGRNKTTVVFLAPILVHEPNLVMLLHTYTSAQTKVKKATCHNNN